MVHSQLAGPLPEHSWLELQLLPLLLPLLLLPPSSSSPQAANVPSAKQKAAAPTMSFHVLFMSRVIAELPRVIKRRADAVSRNDVLR